MNTVDLYAISFGIYIWLMLGMYGFYIDAKIDGKVHIGIVIVIMPLIMCLGPITLLITWLVNSKGYIDIE